MSSKPLLLNKKTLLLGCVSIFMLAGCAYVPTPISPTETAITATPANEEGVSLNIAIEEQNPENINKSTLFVRYHIDCSCANGKILANLTLTPLTGTTPYIIPGFEFVESQSFDGALGDIYSILIESSDKPPLTWSNDIKLECVPIPACPTSPPATLSPVVPTVRATRKPSPGSTAASATVSPLQPTKPTLVTVVTDPPVVVTDPPVVVTDPPPAEPIPTCPPPGKGGEDPPGLCKKK